MKFGFGVDIGGTTVKIAFFDEQGTMLTKWEIPTVTSGGGSQILPDIAASIRQFIAQKTINPADIIGVGIGCTDDDFFRNDFVCSHLFKKGAGECEGAYITDCAFCAAAVFFSSVNIYDKRCILYRIYRNAVCWISLLGS